MGQSFALIRDNLADVKWSGGCRREKGHIAQHTLGLRPLLAAVLAALSVLFKDQLLWSQRRKCQWFSFADLLPYCSWGLVYLVRSKDCICFRHIYLTTQVLSCDWPETLVLQAAKFLEPCGKVDAMWPQLLVICVGSNCILPCKWAFIECLTPGWPQWGGEVMIVLIACFLSFLWCDDVSLREPSCPPRVCHCTPDELLQSGLCAVADLQSSVSLGSEQICNKCILYFSQSWVYKEVYHTGFPSSTTSQNYRYFVGIIYKYLYTLVYVQTYWYFTKNNVTSTYMPFT